MKFNTTYTGALFIGLSVHLGLTAQIKKEVEVVKPYEPVVSDAFKINQLPKISDSVVIKPVFQYNITPTPATTEFQVAPINAAKMAGMPIAKLYRGYLKLGLGNYTTPLGELYVNSLRSKTGSLGAYVQHQSSSGNVTLTNNNNISKSVYGGYSDTKSEVFGKKFFNGGSFNGSAFYSGSTRYFYGYKPTLDTTLNQSNIRQNYNKLGFKVGVNSTQPDSSKLNYNTRLGYHHFADRFSHSEDNLSVDGEFGKKYMGKYWGLTARFNYLGYSKNLDSTGKASTLFSLAPWMVLSDSGYRLRVGFNLSFGSQYDVLKVKLYPQAEFQFVVYEDVIIPFVGISGQLHQNSYSAMASECPYIRPNLMVNNTNEKLWFYGGVKGSLSKKASYILSLDYHSTEKQYLFVNDTSTRVQNTFTAVYTDMDLFNPKLEVSYDFSESLSFATKFNLYKYNLNREKQAWHKPEFDLSFSSRYNLRNKIIVDLEVLALGNRYALQNGNTVKKMSPVLDFNLGAEYRYTKVLSFWLHFNNFTASKYQVWNNYPVQRFQLMGGFTYSL